MVGVAVGYDPWASSPAVRRVMHGNRKRDTRPEIAVRRGVHARGLRYRVAARPVTDRPWTADLVFRGARLAVFVDGCYWHGCPEHYACPRTNHGYWSARSSVTVPGTCRWTRSCGRRDGRRSASGSTSRPRLRTGSSRRSSCCGTRREPGCQPTSRAGCCRSRRRRSGAACRRRGCVGSPQRGPCGPRKAGAYWIVSEAALREFMALERPRGVRSSARARHDK